MAQELELQITQHTHRRWEERPRRKSLSPCAQGGFVSWGPAGLSFMGTCELFHMSHRLAGIKARIMAQQMASGMQESA